MSTPRAIADLDLTPPPGRVYFQTERQWREEFIYDGTGTVAVERAPRGAAFVRVSLGSHQFVVLA